MHIRIHRRTVVALASALLVATSLTSVAGAAATDARAPSAAGRPGAAPLASLTATAHTSHSSGTRARPEAPGENPPGRVTQLAGQAGYTVPGTSSTTLSVIVTLPTVTCASGSNPEFGNVTSSTAEPGLIVGHVEAQLFPQCGFGTSGRYSGWSTLDPFCLSNGFCPYEPFTGGAVSAGDQVQITVTGTPSGASTAFVDLTDGATLSYSTTSADPGTSGAEFSVADYCFLPGGDGEACASVDGSSPVAPPGFGSYTPMVFSSAEVDGTGLGSFLAGPSSTGWSEDNSVWGSDLLDETSYVGSGDSFTVTNSDLTLPTISMPSQSIDQSSTKAQTMQFTATLSTTINRPVYVDYDTIDETAFSGTDYQGVNGTLLFPAGTTTQTISVPILASQPSGNALADGNSVYFELQLTNPSYATGGTVADGTIYEGPVVTSVTPSTIPLDGGPASTITVGGIDFGGAGTADAVQFCPEAAYGGGSCLTGTDVVVASSTSLTVTAPDATDSLPEGQDQLLTDTIVTNPAGISSPTRPAEDQLAFGCTQQSVDVGSYVADGCLTDEPGGVDVAQGQSHVDGVAVDTTAPDAVSYGTSGQTDVASSKPVSVALILGHASTTIFNGLLDKSLGAPVTFTVPPHTTLAGLALSGSLTLTPATPGKATGTVTATLPPVLGGGQGTLSFTTETNVGLSSLTLKVPKATFMQLFSVSDLSLAFTAPGTWQVSGTATTGGTSSAKFSGSLTYTKNTLTAASLQVGGISLAGLVDVSTLSVTLKDGAWSGSATITQKAQAGTEQATIALGFNGTTLTSGSIDATDVPLFGVVNLSTFAMSYTSGAWSLKVTGTAGGSGGSASLNVTGGIVTSASLSLTNVSFLGKLTVASATVSYSSTAPNSACSGVTGTEIWCGSWDVELPQAGSVVTGVAGSVAFQNGTFASATISVNGNLALADGVFLTHLGAGLTINPPPTTISGDATLSFGPTVNSTTLLSLNAQLTRTFPTGATSGSYSATGTLSALSQVLGTAKITVPDSGTSTFNLSLGPAAATGLTFTKLGVSVQVTGSLNGTFNAGTFTLAGKTQVVVNGGAPLSGSMKADNNGMAACASTSLGEVGFEYIWSTGAVSTFGQSGCSERGF